MQRMISVPMFKHEHKIKSFSDRSPINEEFSVKSTTGVGGGLLIPNKRE